MFELPQPLADLLDEDDRYKVGAYMFVFEALTYAQSMLGMGTEGVSEPSEMPTEEEKEEPEGRQQHVTGQDLCEAIRQFAQQQYGYMAKTVLNSWGVYRTGDFGEIVFNLIRHGQMRKTASDRREDFDDVYDFDAAFKEGFKITPHE